jgi:UPF0271 protein
VATERSIDLSADVGELRGSEGRRLDAALIAAVTTAHVAAGAHAGDAATMAFGIDRCAESGTRLGAHPSYPDREGFGRRRLELDDGAVVAAVLEQLAVLDSLASGRGLVVESVKPHGQLYHDLSDSEPLATALFEALARRRHRPVVVLAAGSIAATLATEAGLVVAAEGFCDRAYDGAGGLLARSEPGAVLADPDEAARQALELASEGLAVGGRRHVVRSLCVHSDSPGALAVATAVRARLEAAGIELRALRP